MPASFTTKQSWALATLALLCLAIVATSFYLVKRLSEANWWVNHTLQVQKEIQASLICLMDCETAYRGYLVTGEEQYLEPYEHCYRHVASHIEKFKQLTSDNVEQQNRVPRLLKLAEDKIKFSQMVIEIRRKNPLSTGCSLVSLEPGKRIMDDFRSVASDASVAEQNLLDQRARTSATFRRDVYLAIVLIFICIAILLYWIGRGSRRYVWEQAKARNEIIRIRDEAIAARNEAVQANELKTQFVANISHEIRTPMSGILGLTELLDREETDLSKKETIGYIVGAAQDLMTLVNDLLDFSKLEAGRADLTYRQFRIADVLDSAMKSVNLVAKEKNIVLTKNSDNIGMELICGDPDRLRQVLLNLLHNAVKFTEKGQVNASVRCEKRVDDTVFVRFEVIDTGIGLPATIKEALFLPFVQGDGSTTRKYSGTGLGLSISKKLVGLMGGVIGCENNQTQGAKFWFTVPFEIGSQTKCQKVKT